MAEQVAEEHRRKRSPIFRANGMLRATAAPAKRERGTGGGGLNHLDYLPPLEHARPPTALRFPGRRQIAAYRAGTGILILPRTRPGNSSGGPGYNRSYRKRRETTSGNRSHTTAAGRRPSASWKKVERCACMPRARGSHLFSRLACASPACNPSFLPRAYFPNGTSTTVL